MVREELQAIERLNREEVVILLSEVILSARRRLRSRHTRAKDKPAWARILTSALGSLSRIMLDFKVDEETMQDLATFLAELKQRQEGREEEAGEEEAKTPRKALIKAKPLRVLRESCSEPMPSL